MKMASIIRTGLERFVCYNLLKTPDRCIKFIRPISSRTLRCANPSEIKRPAPWPYNEKRFNLFHYLYDKTSARFDENSKIIVVEGTIAAGKSKLAKALAEELDMLYLPEANLDMLYINSAGFDLRSIDDQVPESYRTFDINNFLVTPKHARTAGFQMAQYGIKYAQYIDALAHVFSTGQGVVLDRCVYSDFVFAETMCNQGYISKRVKKLYFDTRKNSIGQLLRPHLVIYLDVPVKKVIENVKKRNISFEKNSPVINPEYLSVMEKYYKQGYLKEINKHAELLIYDWSEEGDIDVVVEDIERIEFKNYEFGDTKMKDWVFHAEEEYACARNLYSDNKDFLLTYLNVPCFDIPELVSDAEDAKTYMDIIESIPGGFYEPGYDPALGDKGILFKVGLPHRTPCPIRERRFSFSS